MSSLIIMYAPSRKTAFVSALGPSSARTTILLFGLLALKILQSDKPDGRILVHGTEVITVCLVLQFLRKIHKLGLVLKHYVEMFLERKIGDALRRVGNPANNAGGQSKSNAPLRDPLFRLRAHLF